jgi:hypothetical protein
LAKNFPLVKSLFQLAVIRNLVGDVGRKNALVDTVAALSGYADWLFKTMRSIMNFE